LTSGSRSYTNQLEFDIHRGPELKDGVSRYEVYPFINNKVVASSRENKRIILK
jgi:hypothetical protein